MKNYETLTLTLSQPGSSHLWFLLFEFVTRGKEELFIWAGRGRLPVRTAAVSCNLARHSRFKAAMSSCICCGDNCGGDETIFFSRFSSSRSLGTVRFIADTELLLLSSISIRECSRRILFTSELSEPCDFTLRSSAILFFMFCFILLWNHIHVKFAWLLQDWLMKLNWITAPRQLFSAHPNPPLDHLHMSVFPGVGK